MRIDRNEKKKKKSNGIFLHCAKVEQEGGGRRDGCAELWRAHTTENGKESHQGSEADRKEKNKMD